MLISINMGASATSASYINLAAALAVVIAALIAGGVGFFGHLVAKSNTKLQTQLADQTALLSNKQADKNARLQASLTANVKLADMRQAWINNLRDEMTTFQSLCSSIDTVGPPDLPAIYRAGTRIELHMNPDDADYEELRQAMYAFIERNLSIPKKKQVNDRYVVVCQRILKREWDKLVIEVRSITIT